MAVSKAPKPEGVRNVTKEYDQCVEVPQDKLSVGHKVADSNVRREASREVCGEGKGSIVSGYEVKTSVKKNEKTKLYNVCKKFVPNGKAVRCKALERIKLEGKKLRGEILLRIADKLNYVGDKFKAEFVREVNKLIKNRSVEFPSKEFIELVKLADSKFEGMKREKTAAKRAKQEAKIDGSVGIFSGSEVRGNKEKEFIFGPKEAMSADKEAVFDEMDKDLGED